MPGHCKFNEIWLENKDFKSWLRQDPSNKHAAYCSACKTSFSVESMGLKAVAVHNSGKKHKKNVSSTEGVVKGIEAFMSPAATTSTLSDCPASAFALAGTSVSGSSSSSGETEKNARQKQTSDKARYSLRMECRDFVQALLIKLLVKAPVKYTLMRSLSWLNPKMICATSSEDKEKREHLLDQTLSAMADTGRVKKENCDCVKKQYAKLCEQVASRDNDTLRNFDHKDASHCIDKALFQEMDKDTELWKLTRQLLLLSRGQASIERGFSIHKQTTTDNLMKESLKARRLIIQAVRKAGGVKGISIDKDLLCYASSARTNYHNYLDHKREDEQKKKSGEKRKAEQEEIENLNKRKTNLSLDAKSLEESANKKAEDAEHQHRFDLLSESNALRQRSKEKIAQAAEIEKKIAELQKKCI